MSALRRHGPTLAALGRSVPDGYSLSDAHGTLTGADLRTLVIRQAAAWQSLGPGPGQTVGVHATGRDLVVGVVAAGLTGADTLVVDPRLPGTAREVVLRDAGAGTLAVGRTGGTSAGAGTSTAVPGWRGKLLEIADGADTLPDREPLRRRGGRVLVHTSGTTGTPSVAGRSGYGPRQLVPAVDLARRIGLGPDRPVLITPPLWHGYGLGMLSLAMLCGAPVVLPGSNDPQHLHDLITRHGVRVLVSVPPTLAALARQRVAQPPLTPDAIVTGSGPLTPEVSGLVMDTFGDVLFNLYGTTEGGWTALATPADLRAAPGTVGRAAAGTRVRVVDGSVQTRSPLATVRGGFRATGDLGHLDPAGRLFVTGRSDAIVVVGGVNVHLPDVEDALRRCPGVQDAVVQGRPHSTLGHILHALVVSAAEEATAASPTAHDLHRQLQEVLPTAAVPRSYEFTTAVPHNDFGEPLRRP